MIRESLFFEFNGERSTRYKIQNVSINTGLYTEPFMSNRTINEVTILGRDKPYLFNITKDPLSFQVSFYFEEGWDDKLINDVIRWLKTDTYKPLSFSSDWDKVYQCLIVDSPELVHNGLKQGYITLTMRCDSPFVYGRDMTKTFNCSVNSTTTFEILNLGHEDIYPDIYIKKIGYGNLDIINLSKANSKMQLVGIENNEQLLINGENQIIETNLPNTYRYENFNDFYMPLYVGNNVIQVNGKCKIKLQYRYKFVS